MKNKKNNPTKKETHAEQKGKKTRKKKEKPVIFQITFSKALLQMSN